MPSVFINDFDNLEKAVLSENKEYVINHLFYFDEEGIPTVKVLLILKEEN